jgi:mono/diheme cytochrome c family protein
MKTVLKWIGIVLGALAGLLIIAAIAVYVLSEAKINAKYHAPTVNNITASTDPAVIARGQHIANAISVCVTCHGENMGGNILVDDPALARIVAPNLTRGQNGRGAELSDADIARILRYGVKPDGTSVKIMPADDYTHLTDADLTAVISWIRGLPPVDSHLPPHEFRPLGRLLTALNQLDIYVAVRIDPNALRPETAEAVSVEYGNYLANIAGCTGCHGPGLSGGPIPGAPPDWPPAANITVAGAIKGWSETDFIHTIRTGIDPSGHQLVSEMPYKQFANMTDHELNAIWAFLQSMPPKEFGNR